MMSYQFRGVRFTQGELTYREYEQAKDVMKDKIDAFKLPDEPYKKVLNELFDKGVLKDLFQIILKLDEPNMAARVLNRIRVRRAKMDLANIIASMTGSEVARVITDFFLCNKAWTTNLLALNDALSLPTRMTTMERLRSSLRKWSIIWRGRTFSAQTK